MMGELVIKAASRGERRGECGADFTLIELPSNCGAAASGDDGDKVTPRTA